MKKNFLAVCFLLFVALMNINATIKTIKYSKTIKNVKKHEVLDITFKIKEKINSPFAVDFKANFISPSGKKQVIPGFYDGNNTWVLRFSANEDGKWEYRTSSSTKNLNDKKGSIKILNETYKNRKGQIIIKKEDPKHFYWQDGSPYFLMGFECDWLYALDFHNKENTPKLNHFLDILKENKFNNIVMNVYTNDVSWKKDDKLKDYPQYEFGDDKTVFPFLGNNDKPDFSALNVDYFKHLDRTIEELDDRDIISHLMIYVWNKKVNWPDMYSDADNMYFDYIIKRYQAFPNIVWDISKEALYYGRADEKYILERISRLHSLDSYDKLLSVHDYGFCNRNPKSVDFISKQDWSYLIYGNMMDCYKRFKDQPVFNIEHGGYEESPFSVFTGDYINAETCLRRNYQCAFAGSYSTYYWQGCSWNVLIYNPDDMPSGFIKPKFEYYKHFVNFFEKIGFKDFEPSPWFNSAGYCMSNKKGTYICYIPKDSYKTSINNLLKKYKTVEFQWFNTITGEYSELVKSNVKNNKFSTTSPWYMKEDAILIINLAK